MGRLLARFVLENPFEGSLAHGKRSGNWARTTVGFPLHPATLLWAKLEL